MASLTNLSRQTEQVGKHLRSCDQNVEKVRLCLKKEEEMKQEAKATFEETISTTFSQLRTTFASLEAALKGTKVDIEGIPLPKFGKIDDLKSECSQKSSEISRELQEAQNLLRVEIIEIEIQADKQQIIRDEELRGLKDKKRSLELQHKELECEHISKAKVLAEKVRAAEVQMKMRKAQKKVVEQYHQNVAVHEAVVFRNYAEEIRMRQLSELIYKMEQECREELMIRLVIGEQEGKYIPPFDEDDIDETVYRMVLRRLIAIQNQED